MHNLKRKKQKGEFLHYPLFRLQKSAWFDVCCRFLTLLKTFHVNALVYCYVIPSAFKQFRKG